MSDGTVSAGYARALVELAVSKRADAKTLAERSDLKLQLLENPEARVPFGTFKALMLNAKDLCNDPAFGLHFGEESVFADMSIVGLICQSAGTMGEAFHQMNRYARLAIEVEGHAVGNRFELKKIGDELWLEDIRQNPNDFPELTESTFARFVCETARHFGTAPFARFVHFTHAEPEYRSEYDRIMNVPITFRSDKNAICIHESWLSIRTNLENRYVFGIFSDRADALLTELQKAETTRGRVESSLMPVLHTGKVGMDQIATKLGLSRISLYRRLKAEGTSFERILDDLRHNLAIHYLKGKKTSVNEVAYLVGFSDAASFSRAFKRWTGINPSEAMRFPDAISITAESGSSSSVALPLLTVANSRISSVKTAQTVR
jgi:AraC-like DNA-binding protein